jgi:hypothetical protein
MKSLSEGPIGRQNLYSMILSIGRPLVCLELALLAGTTSVEPFRLYNVDLLASEIMTGSQGIQWTPVNKINKTIPITYLESNQLLDISSQVIQIGETAPHHLVRLTGLNGCCTGPPEGNAAALYSRLQH